MPDWDKMWPEWAKIMNNLRSRRLEAVCYQPRRRLLMSEYVRYVTHPSSDSPTFDLLPHVADLARFPPFRNTIESPEEPRTNDNPFASAFAQLPVLIDGWMKELNSEIAGLVKIPSCLCLDNSAGDPNTASNSTKHAESSQTDLDKLHLACAVFRVGSTGAFAHPEVLSVSTHNDAVFPSRETHLSAIGVTTGLEFLEEAPYIVHACGLDSGVATVDDMDHRNARLKCLSCDGRTLIMNWRHAVGQLSGERSDHWVLNIERQIWHACFYHCIVGLAPLSEAPRWQLIGDEHIDAIQAVERSVQKTFSPDWTRCLLCRPRAGDAMLYDHAVRHLAQW